MTIYNWKILEISAENEIITHAKYSVIAQDENYFVETEGNWWFANPILEVPFSEVTEEMVLFWIEKETIKDGINLIKSRLEEQLNVIKTQKTVIAPWLPQVFTPNI
jgi:hypothetical protein